ncbi:MAG TPA: 3-hydroxyacyl-CoA dehydrogenase family protein, partial [Nitrososphaerales archaeon]|nr:3-hydroxyacyl-CoA dehydrogenase family protein [Nitrososphaerales archaeon]
FVEAGIISSKQLETTRSRISTSTDLNNSVHSAQLIIEAVPEKLELKKEIFSRIEANAPKDAILATNTSSLSVTEIAKTSKNPGRIVGTHFLNPPHLVRIVEIVLGRETSPEVIEKVVTLLSECGKKPVKVKDVPGFVHNRLICALMREAMSMVANDIASIESIDLIVKEAFGPRFPLIGIFGLEDNVGLDVLRDVSNQVFPTLDNSREVNSWLTDKIAKGNLGIKSGRGFYEWDDEKALKIRQQLTEQFIRILKNDEKSEVSRLEG